MTPDDQVALTSLVNRYAALVDDRHPEGVAALFVPDGVLITPNPPKVLEPVLTHVGQVAIADAIGQLTSVPKTFHAVVGAVFDEGRGRVACVAHHVLDAHTDLVWHLVYRDDYRLTGAGWRFARRELWIDLIETRPLKRARLES